MESVDPVSTSYGGEEAEPDSSFGYGMNYNPIDPYNMYPHHETGEEVYGPPPMLGYNKHDPFNMKPFNPNMFGSLFGTPVMNTLGPNPFTPLLQPMTPQLPMQAPVHLPPPNPLLMAAAMSQTPGSSAAMSQTPDSSFYMHPYPYYDPFGTQVMKPQNIHPTDPNNQYPHPQTGSMTEPGPALAGGYNAYDPHNLIGAPQAANDRDRILEHNRAAMQPQSPYAPYRMQTVPVPNLQQ